jgi:hypothetical protein
MENNKILSIIINLIEGAKSEKSVLKDGELSLHRCSYLLNQTIRQYQLPKDHYLVSEAALDLWDQLSSDSIFNYTYKNTVKKIVRVP